MVLTGKGPEQVRLAAASIVTRAMAGDEALEHAIRQRRKTMTEAERLFFGGGSGRITEPAVDESKDH